MYHVHVHSFRFGVVENFVGPPVMFVSISHQPIILLMSIGQTAFVVIKHSKLT